ncbi:MAG: LuxR C-terminal-related transcriptional regulator [Desulfuromonadaceae bacterium]|nr:LuxR C-terminal-related transcriptional regulator [Desulfuromonadaceae bacterium]
MTGRKRTEEVLKEQYSILRSIIDSANALIFSVDRQYRYTSFNKGHAAVMKALYGAEIELGRSLYDYMTVPEDRETSRRNIDRALAGEQLVEEAYSGEALRLRQYFQVSHSPIMNENGDVIGVAVLAQDMTERKRVELEILDRQQRLSELTDMNTVFECLDSGARENMTKECAGEEPVTPKRAKSAGTSCFCAGTSHFTTKGFPPASAASYWQIAPALTKREKEVLKLTAEGNNTKECAFKLGVSTKMIETHRKHIKKKLELKNIAQLVTYAARAGLISIE